MNSIAITLQSRISEFWKNSKGKLATHIVCRYAPRRAGNCEGDAPGEAGHDVLRHAAQGSQSRLQEVHARCKPTTHQLDIDTTTTCLLRDWLPSSHFIPAFLIWIWTLNMHTFTVAEPSRAQYHSTESWSRPRYKQEGWKKHSNRVGTTCEGTTGSHTVDGKEKRWPGKSKEKIKERTVIRRKNWVWFVYMAKNIRIWKPMGASTLCSQMLTNT